MANKVRGNKKSLRPRVIKSIDKLYSRKISKDEIISQDIAKELYELAKSIKRMIGLLVSREGTIREVIIGEKNILYLPDLGRYRLSSGRLRRLRFIYSDLSKKNNKEVMISSDIYTDLEKLRFDLVAGLKFEDNNLLIKYANLLPRYSKESPSYEVSKTLNFSNLDLNFTDFIEALDSELESSRPIKSLNSTNRAILIGIYKNKSKVEENSLIELNELARTAGLKVVEKIVQYRTPDPRTLIGKGKLEELVLEALRLEAEIIVFDSELSPSQWRSITNLTELKVLDRSMLILDIFAQRANSSAGRVQVELAQLKYNLPRLTELDAGLSRLTGGIGGRGPGETKLEIGRRRSREKITNLERQIEKLVKTRQLQSKERLSSNTPLVTIIGYTNAGKSTLFNQLTKSNVIQEDKLFATLDTTKRKLYLPATEHKEAKQVILSDTVGFIRNLPKELINAFKATLEEVRDADLLLHLVDASDSDYEQRIKSVNSILESMELSHKPQIIVFNKMDLVDKSLEFKDKDNAIFVSAAKREGFSEIFDAFRSFKAT